MIPMTSGAWPGQDTRSPNFPRVNVDLPVEVSYSGGTLRQRVTTLGGGGMFLALTDPFSIGVEIDVRFRPAKHLPVIQARARTLYQIRSRGLGVQFTEIDPEHRQMLLRLIHHRLAEQRKDPRAPLVTQVTCEQGMSLAFSRDISQGGMFVETPQPVAVGSQVGLRFHLNDGGPVIVASGEVTYQVGKLGMGVRFSEVSPTDRNRIEAYVAKSADLADSIGEGLSR